MKLPEHFAGVPSVGKITPKPGQELATEAIRKWVKAETPRVILVGGVGSGKTFLAASAVRTLHALKDERYTDEVDIRRHACFLNVPRFLFEARGAINGLNRVEHNRTVDHLLSTCTAVVLDDLGAERSTDYANETLYVIVDALYGRNAQTMVTTNVKLSALAESGSARIVSRLSEGATIVNMTIADLRVDRARI